MSTKVAGAGTLKAGSYIVIDDVACKVVSSDHSKSGKHGSAKVRIVAIGLFDEKKREIVMPAHDNVEVPMIDKRNGQVLSISGNMANIMDDETYETFDLEIPEEFKDKVEENAKVLYWVVLGQKVMKQVRGAE